MKPTPEVTQALTNLRVNDDFLVVLDFLASQRSKARDDTESLTEGPKLWRAQGRAITIKEFLTLNQEAPHHLEKFKANK